MQACWYLQASLTTHYLFLLPLPEACASKGYTIVECEVAPSNVAVS